MLDNEIIKKARQANLTEYLLSVGVPLVRNGKRYRHKDHDSLVFTENAYYWNSEQEHGNAIDYLVRHMNMSFKDAVSALLNASSVEHNHNVIEERKAVENFELDRVELCKNQDKVKQYLNKTRLIGYDVINYLIQNKLLYQERETNNAIFPIYDEINNIVGAEIHGTLKTKRFKGIKPNSKYGYGFNVRFSNDNKYDYALFFESAVDLISFIDYKLNHENKSLKRCILISMAGLKLNIVKHTLKVFKGLGKPTVVLCVDNDNAGQEFKKEVERAQIKYIDKSPNNDYKDWNEQLIDTKQRNKPIERLLNRRLTENQELTEQPQCEMKTRKNP